MRGFTSENKSKILPQRCTRQLGGYVLRGHQPGLALVPADLHIALIVLTDQEVFVFLIGIFASTAILN